MLRARVRRVLNPAATGVTLTVTHSLGTTLDAYWWVACSDRGLGRTYLAADVTLPNTIRIVNSVAQNVTMDVFCLVFQGRLY